MPRTDSKLSPSRIKQTLRTCNPRLNRKTWIRPSQSIKMCKSSKSLNKMCRSNPNSKHLTSRSQLFSRKTQRKVTSSGSKIKCWGRRLTTYQHNSSSSVVITKTLSTNTTNSKDSSKKRQTKLNSWKPTRSPTSHTRSILTLLKGSIARCKKKTKLYSKFNRS